MPLVSWERNRKVWRGSEGKGQFCRSAGWQKLLILVAARRGAGWFPRTKADLGTWLESGDYTVLLRTGKSVSGMSCTPVARSGLPAYEASPVPSPACAALTFMPAPPNSFYEVTTTQVPKPDKDTTVEENYKPISLINLEAKKKKNRQQNASHPYPTIH